MKTMKGVMMLERFRKKKPSELDEPIEKLLTQMNKTEAGSKEYSIMVDQLERLNRARAEERRGRVDSNTWAIVIGNLVGIGIIVSYEHAHVVVSKALGFVVKAREPHI